MAETHRRSDASAEALRKKEITLIHVLSTQIGLDEETRRGLMAKITGKSSSKELTWQERKRVIDHLKASGAKVTTPRKAGAARPAPPSRRLDTASESSKVRALWLSLHELGVVRDSAESALAAYVKRIAKVDDLAFCTPAMLTTLIETMKKWIMRECRKAAPELLKQVLTLPIEPGLLRDCTREVQHLMSLIAKPQATVYEAQALILTMRRWIGIKS
jgi:phage gp16-like protein